MSRDRYAPSYRHYFGLTDTTDATDNDRMFALL